MPVSLKSNFTRGGPMYREYMCVCSPVRLHHDISNHGLPPPPGTKQETQHQQFYVFLSHITLQQHSNIHGKP